MAYRSPAMSSRTAAFPSSAVPPRARNIGLKELDVIAALKSRFIIACHGHPSTDAASAIAFTQV